MATDCIPQVTFEFQGLRQPIVARFDQAHASSDGGALRLKVIDERLGLTQRLAAGLTDRRQAGKVEHALIELVRQRVFGIACGYADRNDADAPGARPRAQAFARAGSPRRPGPGLAADLRQGHAE